MFARAVDLDIIGTGRNRLRDRALFIQLGAELIVIGHRQLGAATDAACIRLHLAEDEFDQGRLAGAVRPDQADLVAAQDAAGKIPDDLPLAEAFVDVFQFRHQLARALALSNRKRNLAETLATRRAFQPQSFKPPHAAFVARAARLDALADPYLFLRQKFVEFLIVHGFDRELVRFALLVLGKTAGIGAEPAAIEFGNAGDGAVEKCAIVGHDQHRAGKFNHHVLQPDDRFHVEMIGRLIEHQQLRIARQRARQGHAFAHAARQRIDAGILRQAETRQHGFDAVLDTPAVVPFEQFLRGLHPAHGVFVPGAQFQSVRGGMVVGQNAGKLAESCDGRFENRLLCIEFRLLCHEADAQAGLPPYTAVVGPRRAGQQLEQAGLARAVAPDQPDAAARLHHQVDVIQQWHMAVGERNGFEGCYRHGPDSNRTDAEETRRKTKQLEAKRNRPAFWHASRA